MQRHWKRPWISLAVLAAVATSMLAWPAPASQAQTPTNPGQSDPVGNRPGALTQFPDDELITLNDANSNQYSLVEYSPNPDYSLPAAVNADVLEYRPTGALPFPQGGYQIQNETASGRIIDPRRDVALTLSKIGYNLTPPLIGWYLQEMSFGSNIPNAPKSVPTLQWNAPIANRSFNSDSPGALAIGDLDRVLTPDATYGATYNDEAVVAYEEADTPTSDVSHVRLDVVSYVAQPGQASVVASTTTDDTNTGPPELFAYPCNLLWQNQGIASCGKHPGNIEVATGDLDGDGFEDIILLAMMLQPTSQSIVLRSYLYSYCPAALLPADARVAAGICTAGAGDALNLRGSAVVNSSAYSTDAWAMYQQPVDMTIGDFDGDGGLELAVLAQTYQSLTPNPVGVVTLSIMQWTGTATTPWQKVFTNEPPGSPPDLTLVTNSWFEGNTDRSPRFHDMHLAAGLFKFDPELGYSLNRRQLAVAWAKPQRCDTCDETQITMELWDLASPNSPGATPPSQWTLTRYDNWNNDTLIFCNSSGSGQQNYASFGLVAGNFAGVKANPASPLWGVAVAYESQASPGATTYANTLLFRVDQNIDSTTANGPLTQAGFQGTPKLDSGACGTSGRVELVSLDIDGDSIRLGAPMHSIVEIPQVYDWILQEPPQHLDYFPDGGLVNISRSKAFNVGYTDAQAQATDVTTGSSSDYTVGTSIKANATAGVDGDYLIAKVNLSASVTNQFNYDYDNNQSTYSGSSDIITTTLGTQTSGGDSLSFRARVIDIWRYPAYGVASTNPGQPYAYYELVLPRANLTPAQAMDDLAAQAYGYQPPHENGNVLSYPAVAPGDTFQPPDIGPLILPATYNATNKPANAVLCENNTRYCLTNPLTAAGQQFTFGSTISQQTLQQDQSLATTGKNAWSNKLSDSLDVEATSKFTVFGVNSSGCVNAQVHGGYSWGGSSISTNANDETQTLTLNVPAINDSSKAYHFNPMMYVTGDGVVKATHAAGTDLPGVSAPETWWTQQYTAADAALNLPRKFLRPGADTPSITYPWELNKNWLSAQELRGFWVRSATPNPVTNTNDVVDGVKVGQQVLLDARVYNYSVATATDPMNVRFDLEPVDPLHNYKPTGKGRFTVGTVAVPAIPYHGQTDGTDKVLDNYTSVRYQLDTSALSSATYRVWVVLDPADVDNTAAQATHGWRQPNVILTPEQPLEAGTTVKVDLVNSAGTTETVSYASKNDEDNIAAGLMTALNNSTSMKQLGATASLQDTTTSTPSIVVTLAGAEPPPSTEFRAGLVAGSQQLYFVPPMPTSGVPIVTATNLEYGQNNEGWGLLTVYKSTTPGPMLGSDDACALSSGYSAERGPDIQLRRSSLTPMPAAGRVAGGKTVVQAGDRVPIRVSAFAGTTWAGFEHVTVYQGEPEDGSPVAGTALIRGIDGKTGGHGWFTWQAPTQPGTYTLVAQLQQHHNDAAPGNNQATVEIVVEAGPRLPYRRFLGAISRGPQ